MSRRLWAAAIGVVVMVSLLPVVSAFEAHIVNVTARVKEPFNVVKSMRLAYPAEIAASAAIIDPTLGDGLNSTACNPSGVTADYVPMRTCIVWVVRIDISNPFSYPISNVIVTDNFSAELGSQLLTSLPVDLDIRTHSRGHGKKEKFETQYRITWYVTCNTWDALNQVCSDNSGTMASKESDYIEMLVWTKKNPSGWQEYTSPGSYTLNSGPTMKWLDPQGHQNSSEGNSLVVVAH